MSMIHLGEIGLRSPPNASISQRKPLADLMVCRVCSECMGGPGWRRLVDAGVFGHWLPPVMHSTDYVVSDR